MVKNKELEYVIQFSMEELSILHTWGHEERKMQQPVDIDNNIFQQEVYQSEDKLNEEIDEMRKLMVNMSQKRHTEGKRTSNSRLHVTIQDYISKADEVLQNKVWDPGGFKS